MHINVIASSSAGNACIVSHGQHTVLIEAGITIRDIGKAMSYHITDLDGALISHEHMDHAKSLRELARLGVDCYLSKGTAEALGITGHRIHPVEAKKQFSIGPWFVLPIDLVHDAAEPLGFLICIEDYRLLYACDTAYIPYTFPGQLTHIMLECNYSIEILREKIAAGVLPRVMKRRLMRSHMSIDTVLKFLRANDLSRVQEIWLLHLSDRNSNEAQFKAEVQKQTGKIVKVA